MLISSIFIVYISTAEINKIGEEVLKSNVPITSKSFPGNSFTKQLVHLHCVRGLRIANVLRSLPFSSQDLMSD